MLQRITRAGLAIAIASLACSDNGDTTGTGEITIESLRNPRPNKAVVVVVGDDIADVPEGEEVEYDFHSPENLPEVRFDNEAGPGQGYIRFQFSRVDFPGTVFTHGLSEVFRWHAPDGTQFVTAVNCPMTIDTPHEGPGSSLTGHAVCDMVSGSTEVTVYSKFNYTE